MEIGIKLIVGLGNPGPQYANTRHNVGFLLVEKIAEKYGCIFKSEAKFRGFLSLATICGCDCKLLMPTTFMNLSGESVQKVAHFYKISPESILVIHDELDFSPGVVRLKNGGGAGGHNGVQNIIDQIGANDFWRMRIGIGKPAIKEDVAAYVLRAPSKDDIKLIQDAVDSALEIIPDIILGNFEKATRFLHNK